MQRQKGKKMALMGAGRRKTKEEPVFGRTLSIYPEAYFRPEFGITEDFVNHG